MTKKVIAYLLLFYVFLLNTTIAYAEPTIICTSAVPSLEVNTINL